MSNHIPRPMYLHGLEGSPKGTKGGWMVREYDAHAPEMPAKQGRPNAFDDCYNIALDAVQRHRPSLIVGSSFGGAILMRLILDGHWSGPSVFLAQAGVTYGLGDRFPEGLRAILIHARDDAQIPYEDSVRLANNSGKGVLLWPTDGDHRLHHIVDDGTLRRAVDMLLGNGS